MSALHYLLSYLLFQVSWSQISFTETAANQQFYPRFAVDVGTNGCGLSVCTTCIQIRCSNGVIHNSNQQYDNEYAWNYGGTTFQTPLTFVITKSNNQQIWLNNLVPDYGTWRTWSDGTKFCPPTKSPTKTPTKTPTETPTETPTKTPTKTATNPPTTDSPTQPPTYNPTHHPTTPSPTDPAELTCNDIVSGAYNNIPIPFEVRIPYSGDIVFNASQSDFTFTSLTAYDAQTTPIATTTTKTLTISDIILGDYTFIISADGVIGTFHIQILCPSHHPTAAPSRSPSTIPTASPTANPSKIPTLSPTPIPSDVPTLSPSVRPTKSDPQTLTFPPSENENGGVVEDQTTTEMADGTPGSDDRPKADALTMDNATFIVILGVVIGILAFCILTLLICYFMKSKKENEMRFSMEAGRMMSEDRIATNVELQAVGMESDCNINQKISMQSNVNAINYKMYTDDMALRMWLHAMNMSGYYGVFLREGFAEQLCTVVAVNNDDLQRMGIGKWKDRQVILDQIEIMRMAQGAQQNNGYEGKVVKNERPKSPNEVHIKCDSNTDDNIYNTAGHSDSS